MRPKLLEIEGLQSFTDPQRIDFDALGETGIFGIFGPTGSGKSTILDAITFALFGKVKRAEGGTQGIINSGRNTARVAFTFELAREGGRKLYRVERTYQRKKHSPNSCEPKVARLIEIAAGREVPLCDKATEVSSRIRDLIGLGNEDFTRAVVLPQNSFQEFLLLNNSERRGMLERIFYLEEYGKQLQDKLGRKIAGMKSRIDVMSGELIGYADASDEALESAKKELEEAAAARKAAEKELKQSEAVFNEAKDVWDLTRELDIFCLREGGLASRKEEFSLKRTRLEMAAKAEGLLNAIRRNADLGNRLKESESKLEEAVISLPALASELAQAGTRYEDLKKESAIEQPRLVSQRTRLTDALGLRDELAVLLKKINEQKWNLKGWNDRIEERNALLRKETLEVEKLGGELERLGLETESFRVDPEYRQKVQEALKLENEVFALVGNKKELEARRSVLCNAAAGLDKRLAEIRETVRISQLALDNTAAESRKHEGEKPGDRTTISRGIERVHFVQGQYRLLKLKQEEETQLQSRLELQQTNLAALIKRTAAIEKDKATAELLFRQRREELDEAAREMDRHAAYQLSKLLKEGEACPVCGSTHHPQPSVYTVEEDISEIEQKIEAAGKRLADAEKELRASERETISVQEQYKTLSEQKDQTAKELEKKWAEFEAERQLLPEKLRDLGLEQIRQEIENASGTYDKKLEAMDAWEAKQSEYREKLKKLGDELAGHRLLESSAATEQKVNRESMEQLEQALASAVLSCQEANKGYSGFLAKYGIQSIEEELKRFADSDRRLHELQSKTGQVREEAAAKRVFLDGLLEELRQQNAERIRLEADIGALEGQWHEKESRRKELAGDTDMEAEIARIDARMEGYTGLEEKYGNEFRSLEKRLNELVTMKTMLENQCDIYTESLKTDELQLSAALMQNGFSDKSEVERHILSAEEQKKSRSELEEYDQAVNNTRAQKELIQAKLKFRSITEEEWNRINSMHAEWIARREDCVSRSEIARSNYDMVKGKHDRWLELGKGYTELNRRLGLYDQIGRILKAEHRKDNSFIDYIAEERLRYVAAKASETIGVMTKYRYALELDTEAGFIIRDNTNGGVHRMVTSLSGGETFLTSLSLALALSEQIQLKGQSPLEFFFLDEGFGTLDSELLDTVIDSLERLSSRDRVIGLISHVPELKSRLGRRLVVQPPAMQNEGSKVFLEKA